VDGDDHRAAVLTAGLFKAVAHPVRVLVLEVLADGERPVGELADRLGIELSHLSQQLAVLRRAGVVSTRRVGSVVFYRLRDPRATQLLFVARQLLVASLRDTREVLQRLDDEAQGAGHPKGAGHR
jgi:ArsR family transcriptional regulator